MTAAQPSRLAHGVGTAGGACCIAQRALRRMLAVKAQAAAAYMACCASDCPFALRVGLLRSVWSDSKSARLFYSIGSAGYSTVGSCCTCAHCSRLARKRRLGRLLLFVCLLAVSAIRHKGIVYGTHRAVPCRAVPCVVCCMFSAGCGMLHAAPGMLHVASLRCRCAAT
jgi:hypothetical protein